MNELKTESQIPAESQPEAARPATFRIDRVLRVIFPIAIAALAGAIAWGYFDVSGRISQWLLPPLVPVTGQVYLNGEPLAGGQIFAQAVGRKGCNALGKTDADGRFALRTDVRGDFWPGVYVGEHRVVIIKPDPDVPSGPFKPPVITPADCSSLETTPLRLRAERDPARNHFEFRLETKNTPKKAVNG
jgi:hypothetical protein